MGLHIWHKHLFRKYCPLKVLNAAVIRLLQIRRHMLRLSGDDLNQRYTRLIKAVQKGRAQLCSNHFPAGEDAGACDGHENEATNAAGRAPGSSVHSTPCSDSRTI